MRFQIAQCCEQGGREYNEDTVLAAENASAAALVAADGLGGHGGGKIASQVAAQILVNGFLRAPSVEKPSLQALFDEAEQAVVEKQTCACKMKSTAAALFAAGGKMAFAHMGDSRVYRFQNGKIVSQTIDHSVSQMAVYAGEIEQDQIRFHIDRNRVLRALGGGDARPEISIVAPPVCGDAFLICTDGFWEYVTEKNMEAQLARAASPEQWIAGMRRCLLEHAKQGNDNFSAIAAFYV